MKKNKKIGIAMIGLCLVVLGGNMLGGFLKNKSNNVSDTELINEELGTKREKDVLKQEDFESMIEEALSECDFETEQEKSEYREMLLEQGRVSLNNDCMSLEWDILYL